MPPGCVICLFPENPCPECQRRPPAFTRLHVIGPHAGLLRESLLALKYGHKRDLAQPLGRQLADVCRQRPIDWICPIPLHESRRRERGYDQADLLAGAVARALHRPVGRFLTRIRATTAQQALGLVDREHNVAGAFSLARNPSGAVLLVDDVFTSGATSQEAAGVLLAGGAQSVEVAAVARALPV